jgi:hypothetical protein
MFAAIACRSSPIEAKIQRPAAGGVRCKRILGGITFGYNGIGAGSPASGQLSKQLRCTQTPIPYRNPRSNAVFSIAGIRVGAEVSCPHTAHVSDSGPSLWCDNWLYSGGTSEIVTATTAPKCPVSPSPTSMLGGEGRRW